jgi:hypothetical protein
MVPFIIAHVVDIARLRSAAETRYARFAFGMMTVKTIPMQTTFGVVRITN